MYKEITIVAYTEPRSGITKDNRQWTMQDIVVTWPEETLNHTIFEQKCLFTSSQNINQDKLNKALEEKRKVQARLYFDVRVWNERFYSSNKIYLTDEFIN